MPARRSPALAALSVAALAALVAATAPAAGRPDTARAPSVSVAPKRLAPGETLRVTGRGWPARKRVGLLIGPPASEAFRVATVRAGRRGRFTRDVQISALARPGFYVLLACRKGCAQKRRATFRIVRP